jgi:hypothetical protein
VEKPLAPTLAATRRLLDLAAARRVLLCPVHQFVFQRGTLRMYRMLPRLGAMRHVDLVICSAGADGQSDAVRDQVAFDTLPHPFSLLVRLLGSQFAEISWTVAHAGAGELRLSGVAPGVTAGLVVSMSGRPHGTWFASSPSVVPFRAISFTDSATFERGRCRARGPPPLSTSSVGLVAALTNLGHRLLEREYAYPGLRELVRRLYVAAAGNGQPDQSGGYARGISSLRPCRGIL